MPELSWQLLLALARRAPAVGTQEELLSEVWSDLFVGDEVLSQRVRLLRKSLGDDGRSPRYVKTVRGVGYRLALPVETEAQEGRSSGVRWLPRLAWLVPLLLLVALGAYLLGSDAREVASSIDSGGRLTIAVFPFKEQSSSAEARAQIGGEPAVPAAAFGDELARRLSGVAEIRKLRRRVLFDGGSPARVAQAVRADAWIDGSLKREEGRARVEIRLHDGHDGSLLWTDTLESQLTLEALSAAQTEIAEAVAGTLGVELSAEDRRTLALLPTADLDAYNAYLLGRYHIFLQTPADLQKAISFLQSAVELDPEFAEAWAFLGSAHAFMGTNYGALPPAEAYGRAREAVLRALALDGRLAEARAVHAEILTWYDWDWPAAEREYGELLRIAPDMTLGYLLFLSVQGRAEDADAVVADQIERWGRDPWVRVNAGWHFLRSGRFERSIEEAELAREHIDSDAILGWSHLRLGNLERAVQAFERAVERSGREPRSLSNLAVAYASTGREVRARELLVELELLAEDRYLSAALIAEVYVALGELETALDWLERALADRARDLIFLETSRGYDALLDHPRFQKILAAVRPDA